ncbi:signal peptidase II [Tindallia magadiensis]|uniref:Lipoprotein signal peptidase n=1 Tax=Tindallia magadiensis TaxID=69895 RepID=A0A1I3FYN6_9FIRM|nr:signal peptidase II [Tindallia magadiensis]SFI16353.1 signal peptidase II [Tindallia magadiensis]
MKWVIIFITILLDQLSKRFAVLYLKELEQIPVIEGFFHLRYLENRGAAFGLLQDRQLFFLVITTLIVGWIFWFLVKNPNMNRLLVISLSLISGGAIGNFIDRLFFGYVVDFFDFLVWPVFNIADIAIVIGQVLLIYFIIKDKPINEGM